MQQIEINGKDAFLVYRNGERDTWYEFDGTMVGLINEATVLLKVQADVSARLRGFTKAQPFSDNPFIADTDKPIIIPPTTQPDIPNNSGWTLLHTLPCADNYGEVWICDESIKQKSDDAVEWQLLLFSLTYVESLINEGKLSTCNYTITDDRGKEWVKMYQKQGAKAGQFGGDCGNNHPRKVDIPSLKDDCLVYLPKDRAYHVEITNTGEIPILGWVHHPSGNDRNIFKGKLDAGQSAAIYVSQREFSGQPWDNAMKINGNCTYDVVTK